MAGNSVRTEASSLARVGTLDFGVHGGEGGLVLLALLEVDAFEIVGLADFLQEDMDADRTGAG